MSLGAKLMMAMGGAILAVAIILTVANLRTLDTVVDQAEKAELDSHVRAFTDAIAMESRTAEALASGVAALEPVQRYWAAGDRAALTALLQPIYASLKQGFAIEQFQLHTPPATSYLRLHKPEKFGDDLSSFRHTVVRTNTRREPTRGLEGGVAGLGVRGVVPMVIGGAHVGSVEFGMTFGQEFFDAFKARHKVDAALHLIAADGSVKTFAATLQPRPLLDEAALRRAFAGDAVLHRTRIDGAPRAVYAVALADFSGQRIGVLELAMDRSHYVAALDDAYRFAGLVALLSLAAALAVASAAARSMTRRLLQVADGVRRVAQGDLTVHIAAAGTDEVGQLSAAAAEMRHHLHALALQVRDHAYAVHAAATEIAGAVEGQAATTAQMSASVSEITATMEELSASSTQIAEYTGSVVDIADNTFRQSQQGAEAMAGVLARMADIRSENDSSLTEIMELGTRSKEISKVMLLINAVADQTKLIAFNAALEAASAGEAGRRFGVVAAEIRRLADSVTESTGEIEAKIGAIQDAIQRLVVTSEKGSAGISAGMEATSRTTGRLKDMVETAHAAASAAQQISLSTQQQKTASAQVVVALREIVGASSHTAQAISRISDISRDMTRLSTDLDTVVNRFRLEDASMTSSREPKDPAHAV